MKGMIAIALFAAAGLIAGGGAAAQNSQVHYRTIQFNPGYVQRGSCNINGVIYPVGQDYRVWGYDANGNPWVIGWVSLRYGNVWIFHGNNGVVLQVPCG